MQPVRSSHRLRVRRFLAEPILHFLVIGIAIFAVHRQLRPGPSASSRIIVTRGVMDDLALQHEARWGRPPTAPELSGLVDSYIRDEILYREGIALGLDRDDPVIKRRVRQKLEVMAEEATSSGAATDAELTEYLAANSARFVRPAVLSFEQVLIDGPISAVPRERVVLTHDFDPRARGKPSLLPSRMTGTPADLVARDFGTKFAAALETLPVGQWVGPVDSGFGAHFVRILERTPAVVPSLSQVRDAVVREWENERRRRARDEGYRKLRSMYHVEIETGRGEAVR